MLARTAQNIPLRSISAMTTCSFTALSKPNKNSRMCMDDNAQLVAPLIYKPFTLQTKEKLQGLSGQLATVED